MKKLFLSLIVVLIGTMSMQAQQTDLVATLSSGNNIQTFYGKSALNDAYVQAKDGDVITLSSGLFSFPENDNDLKKAITLRGASMSILADGTQPTYVEQKATGGSCWFYPPTGSNTLTVEGIYFTQGVTISGTNFSPVNFTRCRFNSGVYCYSTSARFFACCISSLNNNPGGGSPSRVYFQSCVLIGVSGPSYQDNRFEFVNCDIWGHFNGFYNSTLRNCILYGGNSYDYYYLMSATNYARNCIAIGVDNVFNNMNGGINCQYVGNGSVIFKNVPTSELNFTNSYELTDAAKTTYLGDDGTQVGIYGGSVPFTAEPGYPRVSKLIVKSVTTDGKLSVNIDVE